MFGLADIAPIYMDYAATTPVAPEVVVAMQSALERGGAFANPSSDHAFGQAAARTVDRAADQLAQALGVAPDTLVWTSGATESDNLAIIGAARYRQARGRHVITSAVEHKAVLDACAQLEREGFSVTRLMPDDSGRITPASLRDALRDDTVLVSLMWVNNETGAINDIAALADVLENHPALLHVDAAQAFGKIMMHPGELAIDLMSLTAHKCYGPKGIGALYIAPRRGVQVEPLLFGGGQQRGLRPGTLPVHQIAGFGAAAALVSERLDDDIARLDQLGNTLVDGLLQVPDVMLNGDRVGRLSSLANVSVAGVAGRALLAAMQPVALATGSACNATHTEPSFVLRALGRDDQLAAASLRFSLGRETTASDVTIALQRFASAVGAIRAIAGPLGQVAP